MQFLLFGMWTELLHRSIKSCDVMIVSALAALPLASLLGRLLRAHGRIFRPIAVSTVALLLTFMIAQGVVVDLALLHPTAEQPLARLDSIPGRYSLWSNDYLIRLSPQLAKRVDLDFEQPDYVLAYDRDVERERLLQAGYGVIDDFDYPAWVYLALPDFRLQTDLTLLGRR